jgi:peptidoglycan/xylan/chitin deacetylase (PgdA/CDA1 family)
MSAARGALLAAAGAVTLLQAGPALASVGPLRRRLMPGLSGVGDPCHVALTFDDGPDPASTPAFLRVLAEHGVSATFFLLGRMLAEAPGLGRELADAGHEVAVHGWEHRPMPLRGPLATHDDLARARDLVAAATGRQPRWYRPPYGVLSGAALLAARRLGLTPVLWTNWGRDWERGATGRTVLETLTRDFSGGATVLLHDSDCTSAPQSWRATLDALPRLLENVRARGLEVGPLGEHYQGRPALSLLR